MASRDQAGYQPPSYDEVAGADYEPLSNADEPVAEASRRETSPRAWTTGLFGCFNNDLQTCCLGMWCPCLLFAKNVEMLTGNQSLGPCVLHCGVGGLVASVMVFLFGPLGLLCNCASCYASMYRKQIREKYGLEEAPCNDLLLHYCCHFCALCQEFRELREAGASTGAYYGTPLEPPVRQTISQF
jgi:Cys-rich protein (TIGR01571 family)